MKSQEKTACFYGKKIMYIATMFIALLINNSCETSSDGSSSENGYVTGLVTDRTGKPLAGVEIVITNILPENNVNINGTTDSDGKYRIRLSNTGTFRASAYINKQLNNTQYRLELESDSNSTFGTEGAIRNFSWKLTGERLNNPGEFYGATLELYNEPGYNINENNISITLTPEGSLIDSSLGGIINVSPIVANTTYIADIPLALYKVSATYNGAPLQLKKLGSNQPYSNNCIIEFEQAVTSGVPSGTAIGKLSYKE